MAKALWPLCSSSCIVVTGAGAGFHETNSSQDCIIALVWVLVRHKVSAADTIEIKQHAATLSIGTKPACHLQQSLSSLAQQTLAAFPSKFHIHLRAEQHCISLSCCTATCIPSKKCMCTLPRMTAGGLCSFALVKGSWASLGVQSCEALTRDSPASHSCSQQLLEHGTLTSMTR